MIEEQTPDGEVLLRGVTTRDAAGRFVDGRLADYEQMWVPYRLPWVTMSRPDASQEEHDDRVHQPDGWRPDPEGHGPREPGFRGDRGFPSGNLGGMSEAVPSRSAPGGPDL